MKFIMYGILIFYMMCSLIRILFMKRPSRFDIYFGVPGSGKTTFAAYLAKKALKNGRQVYSNVDITETYRLEKDDFGKYMLSDCLCLYDEASVDMNNRNYKSNFTREQVKFFKFHRHYKVDLVFFSQGWDDIDITLRRLATRLYLVKPSFIPFFIYRKEIVKKIGINKDTKQIQDEYKFEWFTRKYIFCPKLWKMFNSYECEKLPEKKWEKW